MSEAHVVSQERVISQRWVVPSALTCTASPILVTPSLLSTSWIMIGVLSWPALLPSTFHVTYRFPSASRN